MFFKKFQDCPQETEGICHVACKGICHSYDALEFQIYFEYMYVSLSLSLKMKVHCCDTFSFLKILT